MSLSKKAMNLKGYEVVDNSNFYSEKDVKKAIKELKEKINELDNRGKMHIWSCGAVIEKIDEIFGSKLI